MKNPKILFHDELGIMYSSEGNPIIGYSYLGQTTLIKASLESLSEAVQRLDIPEQANAFSSSKYDSKTRFIRGGKHYATYEIKFYHIEDTIK